MNLSYLMEHSHDYCYNFFHCEWLVVVVVDRNLVVVVVAEFGFDSGSSEEHCFDCFD
jgi:hypothetical protein